MKMMHKMLAAAVLCAAVAVSGCDRAISNMQTIVSDDCGKSWRLISVGATVPARVGVCALKVTIPNYPMAGESNFRGTFANKVLVGVSSSYDYTISDPLKFIQSARFVGKQNSAGDNSENTAAVWDLAENIVIDKLIREVANSPEFLLKENIVDYNQGEFEDRLLKKVNELLGARGVQLNSFTFIITMDDQTRTAIDVGTALAVYESVGIDRPTAEKVITARASATRVNVSMAPADQTN